LRSCNSTWNWDYQKGNANIGRKFRRVIRKISYLDLNWNRLDHPSPKRGLANKVIFTCCSDGPGLIDLLTLPCFCDQLQKPSLECDF